MYAIRSYYVSRSFLPVLKYGTTLESTVTLSPVRGFLPSLGFLCLVEKAPKPRSSTLSPLAKASVISSKTVATIFSTSFRERLGRNNFV